MAKKRIFVLGGTKEARLVADYLHDQGGYRVLSSLAGVTASPRLPSGAVRIGGYGSEINMRDFLQKWQAEAIVDCTHPFAVRISERGMAVAQMLGVPYAVFRRIAWSPQAGDDWRYAEDLPQALVHAQNKGWRRIFAALGRQQFAVLAGAACDFMLLRRVPDRHNAEAEASKDAIKFRSPTEILSGYPPNDVEAEKTLLKQHRIDVLICKESGGLAGVAKLTAARALQIPVLLIRQPSLTYPKNTHFFNKPEEVEAVLTSKLI